MPKKVKTKLKLNIEAGKANPAPPIGPALGQHGVNIMDFCKAYNKKTKDQEGVIPAVITIYKDRSFDFVLKKPPVSEYIKKRLNLEKGSGETGRKSVGSLTKKDLEEIADFKNELIDRYGTLPVEATNLLLKIMLKVLSIKAGVKRLDLNGQKLILYFSKAHQKNPLRLRDLINSRHELLESTTGQVLKVRLAESFSNELLVQTRNILKEIIQRVSIKNLR